MLVHYTISGHSDVSMTTKTGMDKLEEAASIVNPGAATCGVSKHSEVHE